MQPSHVCVVLLAVFGTVASAAQQGRKLKQVTVFYDTPAAAGSTSVGLNGNLAVRPDGTVHAAAGGSLASSEAVSNPLLNALTLGAYKNRPKAASSAYTQIPLLLQQTLWPTLSYGLAEAQGDALSTSNGGWANAEFGYNPLSNNLGASVSSGTSNSANVGASERIGEVNPEAGASGIEFAGYSNDLTNLADARTDQSAQAIAYPYNVLSPINPLTCTQALLYAVTLSEYDLGAPVASLPRQQPPSVVPFCLTFFNFGTLDDFANFVDENGDDNNTSQFFDNGDGRIAAVEDNPTLAARLLNATGSTRVFQRPGPTNDLNQGDTKVLASSGNKNGSVVVSAPSSVGALEGSGAAAKSAPVKGQPNKSQKPKQQRLQSFAEALNAAVQKAGPGVQALASTPAGSALMKRVGKGLVAEAVDGTQKLLAHQGAKAIERLANPVGNLTQTVANATNRLVYDASNVATKAAVAAIESAEPAFAARAALNQVMQPAAKASKAAADKMAKKSSQQLQQTVSSMPDGPQKDAVVAQMKKAAQSAAKQRAAQGASSTTAQMG